jgi:hypothetical protein
METIGARVINELYISHLFSLALSLHGGTESFTYPYGTPNHMQNNKWIPKIPMKYNIEKGKALNPTPDSTSLQLAEKFRTGRYDMSIGKGSESPDANALSCKQFNFI